MVDSRLRFDLVLPMLPEEAIEQIGGSLHGVDNLDCQYVALKEQLLQLYMPKPMDQIFKLIYGAELGDRRLSQLMESMLALLPPGEDDRLLFRTLYLARLPNKSRDHVALELLSSREMAFLADNLRFARNQCQCGARSQAACSGSRLPGGRVAGEDSGHPQRATEARAAGGKVGKQGWKLPDRHEKFWDQAWKCFDPGHCTWWENE